ncbi:hypothetical protein HRR83_004120 [Exophiala dermatitidis]|uniref:Uncharacterized protein n=1 Tax=Exophiala dermatitidis TaxID=5970 RepID=A0AAN6EWI8_EXODE|nr:hypothetical protein HRR73_007763 [Exophiala dermatitidis]KAJ4521576.1 hypothetical protein HRR74_003400 [Exophiala dermatitidis]KAJ4533342.1 hypothetical protein HRR77_008691 [Exophiala dermatitidis]KAJ4545020.1 hypothetical protein HRR76_003051 [Exophiala dermatitidis]KAJ4555013.1 hypothetical protein HRR79_009124 [Exophiala dermatitidis]
MTREARRARNHQAEGRARLIPQMTEQSLDAFLTMTNGSTGILHALRAARGRGLMPLQVAQRADRERTRRLARLGPYAQHGLRALGITAGDINHGCAPNAKQV